MVLSERLFKRRLELGLTRRKIAEMIGVNSRAVEHWESGEANIAPERREWVAKVYQISQLEIDKLCSELENVKARDREARRSLNKKQNRTVVEEYSSSVIGDALFQGTGAREVLIQKLHAVSRRGQGSKPKKFFVEQKRITFR